MRSQLKFANVVSVIALFVALGGSAFAVGLARDSVKSKQIKDGQVKLVDIAQNAVDSARIVDGAVNGADVADGSVTGGDLADGSVTGGDVADGSVTGADLADGSVNTGDFADGSVNGAKVANGGLTGADIADDSIEGADIAEGTLALPAASVGPEALAIQPHAEATRTTSQSVTANGPIVLTNLVKSSGFTINANGGLTAQVPGLYLLLGEINANANDWGVQFSNGEPSAFRKVNETLTKLVRLNPGDSIQVVNGEAVGFTLNGGSASNPGVQLIVVRVGS